MTPKIEQQQVRIAELEHREQELAATVERLRDFADKVKNWNECTSEFRVNFGSNGERDYYRKLASEVLSATPRQSLNAVMRKAFIDGFMESREGFSGELYQDGWSEVVKEFDETVNTKYPSDKDGE